MNADQTPPVSACVLGKNKAETVWRTIRSVRPFVDEVCFLDNGSSDETVEMAERVAAEPGVPVKIDRLEGLGMARARAASVAMASNDWILATESDELLRNGDQLRPVVARAIEEDAGVVVISRLLQVGTIVVGVNNRLFDRRLGRFRGYVDERWVTDSRSLFLGDGPSAITEPSLWHLKEREDVQAWEGMMLEALADPEGYDTPHVFHTLAGLRGLQGRHGEAVELWRRYLDEGWSEKAGGQFHPEKVHALTWLILTLDMKLGRRQEARATARELDAYLAEYAEHGLDRDLPPSWLEPTRRILRFAK